MGNWTCDKHNTHMDERSTPCPYCEIAQLRRELEEIKELHRIQIAAICSATLQNTDSSVKDRIKPDNLYWSVAYGDVCNAIDREIKERKRADELQKELEAYKKARQENDERFMIERDEARQRADLNERAGRLILEELKWNKDRERVPENMTFDYFRKLAQGQNK